VDLNPSKLNMRLAEIVENNISAEMFRTSGKVRFWRAVAFGLLTFGLGSAIGAACFGYSFVTRNSSNAASLSDAIVKAMSKVQLRGTAVGTVQIQPREIKLASGQTVLFDPESRLLLDPGAKIRADGEIKIQTPAISTPQSAPTRAASRTPTITNFTVFKTVPFQKGVVLTGWMFLTSAQKSPTSQYCYYSEKDDDSDVSFRVDIAADEILSDTKTVPKAFDLVSASSKCVWFDKSKL
jgi:hypothetical protein